MNRHTAFFDILAVAIVLLVSALLTPALLAREGASEFTALIADAFLK